jgi:BolA protein
MERMRAAFEANCNHRNWCWKTTPPHAGHAGAASGGGHYNVRIVSLQFEGLKLVTSHRLVYDSVHDMMHKEIHALAITALAPSEV